jgi:hypothetical protein
MGQILSWIRAMRITSNIIARHTPKGNPRGVSHRLEHAIIDAFNKPEAKIYVHWGGYESGKSRAASNVRFRLQRTGRLVIILHGFDFTHVPHIRDWLRLGIGIPESHAGQNFANFLPPKMQPVLIIDHADLLLRTYDNEKDLASVVLELGIPVLILFSSWERALNMLEQEKTQLLGEPGLGRWTREELEQLFDTFPDSLKQTAQAKPSDVLSCATIAGSPGVLCYESQEEYEPNMSRAHLIDTEWKNGIRALNGEDMQGVTGRFPDKNHRFHWAQPKQAC